MRRSILLTTLGFLFATTFSCTGQNDVKKQKEEQKADSLEKRTQHAMDSAQDAYLKLINSMPDSDIVNDPNVPTP